jgi:hypothetical protein
MSCPRITLGKTDLTDADGDGLTESVLGRAIERPDYFEIRRVLRLGAAAKIRDADGRLK